MAEEENIQAIDEDEVRPDDEIWLTCSEAPADECTGHCCNCRYGA